MMQQQKDDQTNREAPSAQEDAVGSHPYKTAERRHVDALLDISDETLMKELEPNYCCSTLEDAVCGWVKAAPLACILMTQNINRKPTQKEANNLTPLSVNPTPSNTDHSARIAEQHSKSHAGLHKKSMSVNQQTGSWDQTEFALLYTPQKNRAHSFLQEKTDEDGMTPLQPCLRSPQYFVLESRPTKPEKHSHKSNNIVVPIKNFTFLPPIKSLQLNPKASGHVCKNKKVPGADTFEENLCILDKRSGTRRTQAETVTNSHFHTNSTPLNSICQKYQQKLRFISDLQVSVPGRYHASVFQT